MLPHTLFSVLAADARLVRRGLRPFAHHGLTALALAAAACLPFAPLMPLTLWPLMAATLAFMALLAVVDARLGHLPLTLVVPLAGCAMALPWAVAPWPWPHLTGALMGGLIFGLLKVVVEKILQKPALGLGDVTLITALGALVGPMGLPLLWLASSASVGLFLVASRLRGRRPGRFPYGPHLLAGAYATCLLTALVQAGHPVLGPFSILFQRAGA